jgi:hypothetical protein
MGRNGAGVVLLQDKEQFAVARKPRILRGNVCNTPAPRCSAFLLHCWPLFVAVISVAGTAIAPRLGIGLNVSRSAPSGIYQAVASAPTRGAFVAACLPAEVAVLGRARGYLGPGDCHDGPPTHGRSRENPWDGTNLWQLVAKCALANATLPPSQG